MGLIGVAEFGGQCGKVGWFCGCECSCDFLESDAPAAEREAFFAKDQPCLRASPLGKRYGWRIHHDQDSRIALVPIGSPEYDALARDESLTRVKAMRSRRA